MTKIREIISLVGRKRFMWLLVFAVITALLAAAWQKYFLPLHKEVLAEEGALQSERGRLQQEIIDIPKRYAEQKANIDRYEILKAKGFFSEQDRIEARSRMDKLRAESGLRGINYDIDPQEVVAVPEFPTMTDNLTTSHIKVEMKGLTDLEMRNFILKMTSEFSGLLNLRALELGLGTKLDAEGLKTLGQKTPVDFIKGTAEFDWYSILPKPVDPATLQANAYGGQPQ